MKTSKEIKLEISKVNKKMTMWKNIPFVNSYYKAKFQRLSVQYAVMLQYELKHKKRNEK